MMNRENGDYIPKEIKDSSKSGKVENLAERIAFLMTNLSSNTDIRAIKEAEVQKIMNSVDNIINGTEDSTSLKEYGCGDWNQEDFVLLSEKIGEYKKLMKIEKEAGSVFGDFETVLKGLDERFNSLMSGDVESDEYKTDSFDRKLGALKDILEKIINGGDGVEYYKKKYEGWEENDFKNMLEKIKDLLIKTTDIMDRRVDNDADDYND